MYSYLIEKSNWLVIDSPGRCCRFLYSLHVYSAPRRINNKAWWNYIRNKIYFNFLWILFLKNVNNKFIHSKIFTKNLPCTRHCLGIQNTHTTYVIAIYIFIIPDWNQVRCFWFILFFPFQSHAFSVFTLVR